MRPLFPPPACADPAGRPKAKGKSTIRILTVNGGLHLQRQRWYSREGGSLIPVDAELGNGKMTVGVREMVCRLGTHTNSFRMAAEDLCALAQLEVSHETVRHMVEQEGQAVERVRPELPPAWRAEDCQTDSGTMRMYLGCDGVMVPLITDAEKAKRREKVEHKRQERVDRFNLQGCTFRPLPPRRQGTDQSFKEMKLVKYYDDGNAHTHVCVTMLNHRMAQVLMSRSGRHLALHRADEKIANIDGAEWIRNRVEDAELNLDAVGLDFYHLSEHIHAAGRAVYGEGDEQGKQWVGDILHTVKHEGFDAAWEKLVATRQKLRSPTKRKALDKLMQYMSARQSMIQYPMFLEKGWQIGSGPTEGACRTIPDRLKGRGRRWDSPNAQAMANLTALRESGQWQTYWNQARAPAA